MDNGRAGRERSVATGKAARGRVPLESLVGDYARTLPADRQHLLGRFRLTRVARKVVGVGSVGTQAWILLMEAEDDLDPLMLQAKQAERSVLAAYAGDSQYDNQGERDRKSTRLNSSHSQISYAVFC